MNPKPEDAKPNGGLDGVVRAHDWPNAPTISLGSNRKREIKQILMRVTMEDFCGAIHGDLCSVSDALGRRVAGESDDESLLSIIETIDDVCLRLQLLIEEFGAPSDE